MAARLVERLGLNPPIDVEALCKSMASVSFKSFPIQIDGICLDLKVSGKMPKVWVSRDIPPVRQRFTLAHEIGHIIIPWHRGTIVDDIESPRSRERGKYREMESEANRFAAELLMPSAWAVGLAERADHVAGLMHSIRQIADVSFPAAFIKSARYGRPNYVGAEVRDGVVVRSIRTPQTYSKPIEAGTLLHDVRMPAAYEPQIVNGPDTAYFWWEIKEALADPGGDLPHWREILDEILQEVPPEFRTKTRASLAAIIGLAIGKEPKGAPVEKIYLRGMEAAQNRDSESFWVAQSIEDQRFESYVLARARERAAQNP